MDNNQNVPSTTVSQIPAANDQQIQNTDTSPKYQHTYMSEEDRLKKFMSAPKFVAARDLMASPIVLVYTISLTVLLLYNIIGLKSYLHPFMLLLCYVGWTTYLSAHKSKKENKLPNANGIGLASVLSTIMMAIIIIAAVLFAFTLISIFAGSVDDMYYSLLLLGIDIAESDFKAVLSIFIIVALIGIILGILFYRAMTKSLKSVKYCITNEEDPERISLFVPVFIFVSLALSVIIYIFAYFCLMDKVDFDNPLYRQALADNSISSGFMGLMIDYVEEQSHISPVVSAIAEILSLVNSVAMALFFMNAANKLNPIISSLNDK